MDSERDRTATDPTAPGPTDFAASADWVRAYTDLAGAYGWPVTYFVHPEVAEGEADLFVELKANGGCLGLHVHPWKFGDRKYMVHFGGLTAHDQRAVVSDATAWWQKAFGRRPECFRPRKNYDTVLSETDQACRSRGIEPVGATIAQLSDMVLALPVKEKAFVAT